MIPIVKLMLVLVTVLGTVETSNKGQKSRNQKCDDFSSLELQLRNAYQKALNAIGVNRKVKPSDEQVSHTQHVFNNGLLGFHRSVLQELLEQVGGYDEQLENLTQVLMIPLNKTVQNAISTWVATFSSEEHYVDFNADVYGEYVRQLRNALVEYLKADTSVNKGGRNGIQEKRRRVQFIASEMVNHEVYVDPMARDRWLQENQGVVSRMQLYNQVRGSLRNMFQNIRLDFKKVSDMIRVFRRRNKWNWDRDLK